MFPSTNPSFEPVSTSDEPRRDSMSRSQRSNPEIKIAVLEVEANSGSRRSSGRGSGRRRRASNGEAVPDDGIYLTWENLWVSFYRKKSGTKSILQGLDGYARPGEFLAIMGPSGCGKSTLLDTLAGRLPPTARQTGDILINGRKESLAYGTSAYVTQDEALITTLTVRETIFFSAQLQLPDSMSIAEKKERAEMTIREMGLQDAMETRIGGWEAKGLSGGQKRRVSICIEILTHPKLLFLDEPTSGLDSAAAYYVISRIAHLSQRGGIRRTIIASIHQPSSEVFELFDNLCLLSSGRTVYFGPASAAAEFFAASGFPCPLLHNPSDHFLKTINKDFEEDTEGLENAIPTEEAINVLVNAYKSSDYCQQTRKEIAEICKMDLGLLSEKKRSRARYVTQCKVLIQRSFINMYRDPGYYWMRLAIYILLGIALGTMYINIGKGHSSIQARGNLLMFITSFLTFMAIGGFPSFVEDMKVFERERLNGHYSPSAFVFGNTFSAVPFLILIAIVPGAIMYLPPGLQKGVGHFFYFAVTIFACMMLVESLMMIVASFVPNYLMGIITGAGIQGLMILCGGFFRLPNDIPKPIWRYPLFYIAFHRYGYQGLFKNEFKGLTFPNDKAGGSPIITGEEILRDTWQVDQDYSKWVDLLVLFSMVVIYRTLFLIITKTSEKIKPLIASYMSLQLKQNMQTLVNPSATPPPHTEIV